MYIYAEHATTEDLQVRGVKYSALVFSVARERDMPRSAADEAELTVSAALQLLKEGVILTPDFRSRYWQSFISSLSETALQRPEGVCGLAVVLLADTDTRLMLFGDVAVNVVLKNGSNLSFRGCESNHTLSCPFLSLQNQILGPFSLFCTANEVSVSRVTASESFVSWRRRNDRK